jgi:glycosyltransferase involved in cell wall biosynthesis
LSERLVKRGHRVTVATTKLADRTFAELNGVQIEEFDVRGAIARGFTGSDIARYQQFLLKHPADIMMNYAAQQWATDLAFDMLASTSNRRVSIIAPCGYSALSDSKTLQMPQFADYFNNVIPTYLPNYDAAVYHSGRYQDYEFAQNHGFNNSVIIPNGVCEEEFSQPPKVAFRQKYNITTRYMGLCVANFYKGKGQDKIIECVRQMNRPDFTIVCIGKEGGELGNLYKLASGLNVRFCVGIEREDTLAAYHEADIFLFGSEKECSPLVIVEAKASRTPFVSTDCGNVREWKGGVVCAPEKMAVYANRILDEEIIHRSFAEDGWREWKEKLTWETIVDKYEELYLELYYKKTKAKESIMV